MVDGRSDPVREAQEQELLRLITLGVRDRGGHDVPHALRRLRIALELEAVIKELVDQAAVAARADRITWTQIGVALGGRTKQAAQKRFRRAIAGPAEAD